ncbi:MAG: amidohydrolase [Deltaproteobacteria bacterium]|nr:amidohydrolase [Deltaproteobacteria bacterium]
MTTQDTVVLYSCAAVGSSPGGSHRTKRIRGRKTLTVDIHCHISTPQCEPLVRNIFSLEKEPFFFFASPETREINQRLFAEWAPKFNSPEERLKDMDSMGIDIQAISPSPAQYYYWTDGELGLQLARMQNDRVAEIVQAHPSRFVGMGTLPLQDVDKAVLELERIVRELGLRAVEISTNVNGVDFDDPRFQKFFAKAEELDVLIFIHPIGFTDGGRLRDYYLINVIGQPLESTVAVSRLIFGGVLERYHNLKICVAHGGGYLPYYAGRMDHAYKVRPECQKVISRPPSAYLRQLYYDTVIYTGESLAYLVRQVGSDHVLLGTDYPADMGEVDPVGHIGGVRSLSRVDKEKIWGGNAARLLKIQQ